MSDSRWDEELDEISPSDATVTEVSNHKSNKRRICTVWLGLTFYSWSVSTISSYGKVAP
jgi:hypothetical protein